MPVFPMCSTPQTLDQALALLRATFRPLDGIEHCPLSSAPGRVLAADIRSDADLPRFDMAAMDGYALAEAGPVGTRFRVTGVARAGHPFPARVGPGDAVQILTGAAVPDGTRCVVMQEHTVRDGDRVTISVAPGPRDHIRRRGEDLAAGQRVLRQGTRIGAGEMALLAALGVDPVPVMRRPVVTLISTGDELKPAGPGAAPLRAGHIHDSNGPMLAAELAALGVVRRGPILLPDDPNVLTGALIDAARDSDLILTTGGASSGVTDHLTRIIRARGCLEFWQLRLKPGRPVGLGDIDDCPILALPGNPVAAAVTFALLAQPLLAILAGHPPVQPVRLPLAEPASGAPDRLTVLAGRWAAAPDGALSVRALPRQGAANLMALADAEVWLVIREGTAPLRPGDLVQVLPRRGPAVPA